jgi:phosphoribosylformimino-5-aminoimidazole carboxamide ribonucleotide (ProFAR) isomerase
MITGRALYEGTLDLKEALSAVGDVSVELDSAE